MKFQMLFLGKVKFRELQNFLMITEIQASLV